MFWPGRFIFLDRSSGLKLSGFPLFDAYPELKKIKRVGLGDFPTPLEPLNNLAKHLDCKASLWIKRDDLSSSLYGGNKVRKLEFTLAKILDSGARSIITGGGLGSHMANATVAFAHQYGIPVHLVLLKQPINEHVRQNILFNAEHDAQMSYTNNKAVFCWRLLQDYLALGLKDGRLPYFIMPGNSQALSNLGYVNMAFELRQQIQDGDMTEPDYIFVSVGSCGTFAGLWLGLYLAGLKSQLVGVQVMDRYIANPRTIAKQVHKTCDYLQEQSPDHFVRPKIRPEHFNLRQDYLGSGYGHATQKSHIAQKMLWQHEQIALDPTYTAKTMAAMLEYAVLPENDNKQILFLHTYSSVHRPVSDVY